MDLDDWRPMDELTTQDPLFRLYRQHDRLVRRNLASPIRCKVDNARLITMLGSDDNLVLKCFNCGSIITPGSKDIDAVKKVVGEHFE